MTNVLLFFVLFCVSLSAQTIEWRQPQRPVPGQIRSLYQNVKIFLLYALSNQGVYRSSVNGGGWTYMSKSIEDSTLRCFTVFSEDEIMVGSDRGKIYQTTNKGTTWQEVSFPVQEPILELASTSSGLWAVTPKGLFLRKENTWIKNTTIPDSTFIGICSSRTLDLQPTILAASANRMYSSKDKGTTWTALPSFPLPATILSISADAESSILIAGTTRGIFTSTNEGKSWRRDSLGLAPDNQSVKTFSCGGVFAAIAPYKDALPDATAALYGGGYNGFERMMNASDVVSLSGDNDWFSYADTQGNITRRGWGTSINVFLPLNLVPVPGAIDLLAVKHDLPFSAFLHFDNSEALKRGRDINTWIPVAYPAPLTDALFFNGILYASGFMDGVASSSDGGLFWTILGKGLPELRYTQLAATTYNLFMASADTTGLYRSLDGGIQWEKIGNASSHIQHIATAGSSIYAITDARTLQRSYNDGMDWEEIPLSIDAVTSLTVNSEGVLFAVHSANGVVRSADSGKTWQPVSALSGEFYMIAADPSGRLVLACSRKRGVYASLDKGEIWIPATTGLADSIVTHIAFHRDTIYLGTASQGLYYGVIKEITSVEEHSEDATSPLRIEPQPASEQCTVFLHLPQPVQGSIILSDMQGRHINTLAQGTLNSQSFVVNTTSLYNGVYVVQLQTMQGSVFKKILVVH